MDEFTIFYVFLLCIQDAIVKANKLAKEKNKLIEDLADATDDLHATKDGLGPLKKVSINWFHSHVAQSLDPRSLDVDYVYIHACV